MKLLMLVGSLAVTFAAGLIGNIVTQPSIPTWYAALEKPFFTPPNWIFGPVWTLLYVFMAVALWFVCTATVKQDKKPAYIAFGVQLVLNTVWSVVFFGLQQPWLAVGVIIALLIAIALTMKVFWVFSRPAVMLLIPYLCWVSFATALTVGIALLN